MQKPLYSLSWMLGFVLAPHSLVLLGNLAGGHRQFLYFFLAVMAAIYWINVRSADQWVILSKGSSPSRLTPLMTMVMLASRILTTIALSTVLLVAAGFVFNETFVFWFPNFAFAFILLGIVLAVNLWGRNASLKLQVGATAVILLGLIYLIIAGLWGDPGSTEAGKDLEAAPVFQGMTASLLLLVGFDLSTGQTRTMDGRQVRRMQWAVISMALLMGVWGWISLRYVPAAKLSDSFIPHILTARNIQGEAGRIVMGAIVIAGALTAVNALLQSLSQWLSDYAARLRQTYNQRKLKLFERPGLWQTLMAAGVGLMMAGGMAGTEVIDHYVRAGLILWLLYYGGVNLSVLTAHHPNTDRHSWRDRAWPLAGAVAIFFSVVVLLVAEPGASVSIIAILITGALGAMVVLAGFFQKKPTTVK